jgi:hypothetical protein
MSASIKSSDFCREPRAIHGTISEVAGMPMPRMEGAILEQCCRRIGSQRAAEEVKTIMWDSGIYLSMGDSECRFRSYCYHKTTSWEQSSIDSATTTAFLICTSLGRLVQR